MQSMFIGRLKSMLLYRVESEEKSGKCNVWLFEEDGNAAKRKIKSLSNEKTPKTVWAELSTCLGGDNDPDIGWEVEYGFEREVAVVLGHKVLTGRMVWY